MHVPETTKAIDQRLTARREEGFNKFMQSRETKLLLSMVPATEPPELLETLLRCAFDAGNSAGEGAMVAEMLTAVLTKPQPGREGF